jgi:hypothetical protein
MSLSRRDKQRWVVNNVDTLTVASIKVLATSKHQSVGYTLDQAVEYFSRKVKFTKEHPLKWELPDDF